MPYWRETDHVIRAGDSLVSVSSPQTMRGEGSKYYLLETMIELTRTVPLKSKQVISELFVYKVISLHRPVLQ